MNKDVLNIIRQELKANIDEEYRQNIQRFSKEKINIGDCPLKLVLGNVL